MSTDSSDDDELVIVVDNGSSTSRSGFASGKTNCSVIPTVCGKLRPGVEADDDGNKVYIGDDALNRRGKVSLHYPIERGIIQDFDLMEKIWHYILTRELRLKDNQEFSMLLTEPPTNMPAKRAKMAEIMFETFNVRTLKIAVQHELSLMSNCRTNGVVIDSGDGATNIASIHNGKVIQESIIHFPFGGRDLTEFLSTSLTQNGRDKGLKEHVDVKDIKRAVCYIPVDYTEEMEKFSFAKQCKTYETPGGNSIQIGNECFQCPEVLFQPSLIHQGEMGIHHAAHNSILKCPAEIQAELYNNIVLVGGNTIFRGISERMEKEMSMLAPAGVSTHVVAAPERIKSVWLGGSIMGSVDMFLQDFITKESYVEHGPTVVS